MSDLEFVVKVAEGKSLLIRSAKASDFEAILAISEGVYDGLDYLPQVYQKWISESASSPKRRQNFVAILQNESKEEELLVGFRSLYFINGGQMCVDSAFRVALAFRGHGFGTAFTNWQKAYLRRLNPQIKMISCISDGWRTDEQMAQPAMGRLISTISTVVFRINLESPDSLDNLFKKFEPYKDVLTPIDQETFAKSMLDKSGFCDEMFPKHLMIQEWVPYSCKHLDDLLFMSIRNVPLVTSAVTESSGFSILTQPYAIPRGYKAAVDFYMPKTADRKCIDDQLTWQLFNLFKYARENSIRPREFYIFLFIQNCFAEVLLELMTQKYSISKKNFQLGPKDRKIQKMYIYEKSL